MSSERHPLHPASLCSGGLDIPHERIGSHGSVCWFYAVHAPSYPWGVPVPQQPWRQVFHQVRRPLDAIASITTISQDSWDFIRQHIVLPESEPLVDRCARFWLIWNRRTEDIAHWRYRLEDASATEIAGRAGLPWKGSSITPHPHTNQRQHEPLKWSAIADPELRRECQEMARRYGYTTPNDF